MFQREICRTKPVCYGVALFIFNCFILQRVSILAMPQPVEVLRTAPSGTYAVAVSGRGSIATRGRNGNLRTVASRGPSGV